MTRKSHTTLVSDQFGPRAAAYLASGVHAKGEDLDALAKLVEGRKTARVLDLGCGGGHVSYRVAPHVAEVVAYDLSPDMLAAVAKAADERGLANLVTRQGNVEKLPFADAAFDFVLSRYSAHHWQEFHAGLREARRVLNSSGRAVFVDTISPGPALLDTFLQTVEMLRDPSHLRDYSRAEWIAAMSTAGFVVGPATERRVRLEFASWIERMATPTIRVEAIRSLQKEMSADVVKHFQIEADGSFTIDVMSLEATAG